MKDQVSIEFIDKYLGNPEGRWEDWLLKQGRRPGPNYQDHQDRVSDFLPSHNRQPKLSSPPTARASA